MRHFLVLIAVLILSSCQMGYYFKSAKNQLMMMSQREPIDKILNNQSSNAEIKLNEAQIKKLELSQKARVFAFEKLKLKKTKNYSTYIELGRPFVTWVVQAAYPWEVKNYEWSYPIVGRMPYKGFFSETEALEEAEKLKKEDLDVYVRGVSAYSTLGWFQDSVLSSMLRYRDHHLVNTIIHELVHTTLYIKNNADFNERLAVFIGNKGTEIFYRELEGEDSATLKLIQEENNDDQKFSVFISDELNSLSHWYLENQVEKNEDRRQERLQQVIDHFNNQLKPNLKTNLYSKFDKEPMNNAKMGTYKTYMENLDEFEEVYAKLGSNLPQFIQKVKALEKSDNPQEDLKKLVP